VKALLILTTSFPFDTGEEFLASELQQASGFDRIFIFPCGLKPNSRQTRPLPAGVECLPAVKKKKGRAAYFRLFFSPGVIPEVFRILKTHRCCAGRVHELLYFLKNAEEIEGGLEQIRLFQAGDRVVLYSYWFYSAAVAAARYARVLRKQGVHAALISRAHGFDIHNERAKYGYLPMRSFLFQHVDRIFPCSEDGAEVLRSKFPRQASKVQTAYLGTRDCGTGTASREPFHLVSCSYMVPVKRIHLIAEALRRADFPVVWTHIGSGPLENEIHALARQFPANVKAEFPGMLKNEAILKYYQTCPVSAFVNVSSSEGIPVSIMEACSFGFPVIATKVGGTPEIVLDGVNGFLLPSDFTPQMFLDCLNRIRFMSRVDYAALCTGSRKIWQEKFSALKNYSEFYSKISRSGS
jgi:glycosyltransferase involved in cell wall biosynthesis